MKGRTFCGPHALSHLLGISPRRAEQLLSWAKHKEGGRRIRGIEAKYMVRAVERFGAKIEPVPVGNTKRYVYPVKVRDMRKLNGRYLLNVPGHYLAIVNHRVYSNGGRAAMRGRGNWAGTGVVMAWRILL